MTNLLDLRNELVAQISAIYTKASLSLGDNKNNPAFGAYTFTDHRGCEYQFYLNHYGDTDLVKVGTDNVESWNDLSREAEIANYLSITLDDGLLYTVDDEKTTFNRLRHKIHNLIQLAENTEMIDDETARIETYKRVDQLLENVSFHAFHHFVIKDDMINSNDSPAIYAFTSAVRATDKCEDLNELFEGESKYFRVAKDYSEVLWFIEQYEDVELFKRLP
jgi:hypothetical protein